VQGLRRVSLLRAPAHPEDVQGVRRVSHLRAAHPEDVQGLRRVSFLRAPAHPAHVQGLRRVIHLRSASTSASAASARITAGQPSASTSISLIKLS
jgi:hypothetical protein